MADSSLSLPPLPSPRDHSTKGLYSPGASKPRQFSEASPAEHDDALTPWDQCKAIEDRFLADTEDWASMFSEGSKKAVKHRLRRAQRRAASRQCFVMPCTEKSDEHRSKIIPSTFGLQAAVARPVGKKEIQQHPKALEAQKSEWERLWDKDVWDWRKNKYQDLDLNHLVQEWTNGRS